MATKYEELCSDWVTMRKAWTEYRSECAQALGSIAQGVVTELEIPEGQHRLLPLSRDAEPNKVYSAAGAIRFDGNENGFGYWQLGLSIKINQPPRIDLVIPLRIKTHPKDSDAFEFQMGTVPNKLTLPRRPLEIKDAVEQVVGLLPAVFSVDALRQITDGLDPMLGIWLDLDPASGT